MCSGQCLGIYKGTPPLINVFSHIRLPICRIQTYLIYVWYTVYDICVYMYVRLRLLMCSHTYIRMIHCIWYMCVWEVTASPWVRAEWVRAEWVRNTWWTHYELIRNKPDEFVPNELGTHLLSSCRMSSRIPCLPLIVVRELLGCRSHLYVCVCVYIHTHTHTYRRYICIYVYYI
jgi:hypothetical protein